MSINKNNKLTKNKLILLGTKGGPAVLKNSSMPSSSLLFLDGKYILIDCGLGVSKRLLECNIGLQKLDIILITHLHSDHILELGPLIHTIWASGSQKKIQIFAPVEIIRYMSYFLKSMKEDIQNRINCEGRKDIRKNFEIIPLRNGINFNKKIKISSLKVKHPPIKDSFALKINGSKQITFSGDTRFYLPIIPFSHNSDILIHEAMLESEIDQILKRTRLGKKLRNHLTRSHTPIEKVFEIAERSKVKKLVINHLVPPLNESDEWLKKIKSLKENFTKFETILGKDKLEIII